MFGPSGDDANPFNQRLPAEVVSRRARPQPKKAEPEKTDQVEIDLQTAISLRPEKRLAWLLKACKMAADGKASCGELFNIVTTRRFASVPEKVGKKMRDGVLEHVGLFSDKQQRHLRSEEWALNVYGDNKGDEPRKDDSDSDDEDENQKPAEAQDAPRKDGEPRRHFTDKVEKEKTASSRAAPVDRPLGKIGSMKSDGGGGTTIGGWVSVPQINSDRQARHALLALERRKAKERDQDEKPKEEEPQELGRKKRQHEQDVDSSLQMLESLNAQKQHSPRRSSGARRDRGLSRSRSISVKRSPSRKKKHKGTNMDRQTFEAALAQRMNARDKADTTRNPVSHWRSTG